MPIMLKTTCVLMFVIWLGVLVFMLLGPEKIYRFFRGIRYDIKRFFRGIFRRKKKNVNSASRKFVPKEMLKQMLMLPPEEEAIVSAVARNEVIPKEMLKQMLMKRQSDLLLQEMKLFLKN